MIGIIREGNLVARMDGAGDVLKKKPNWATAMTRLLFQDVKTD